MIAPTALPTDASLARRAPAIQPGFLIEIGEITLPLYGNAAVGWSIEQRDIAEKTPYRSASLDELIFAVLNFCIHTRGGA